ncbi:adenylate/guanylate cyclase catalytic domain protein, partial [Teladorsagia circumcincta]
IPEVGGKERYLWESDTDRNDGRDSEAKEAFLHLFAITDGKKTRKRTPEYDVANFILIVGTDRKEEKRYELPFVAKCSYRGEVVAAHKHESKLHTGSKDSLHWRTIRHLDHENLNRFIGICRDAPQMLSLWKYCSRGSFDDVIRRYTARIDAFFVFAFMKDMANSKNCLVGDHWDVKISDFGLNRVELCDKLIAEDLLWTSPENLRSGNYLGSQEGDIYSFGIISAQLVTKTKAWDLNNRKEDADEIIYMLKKGGYNAPRPDLLPHETIEVNPALLHLIRDCWAEHASERPNIVNVKHLLKSMQTGKDKNLMDYVFHIMENYASSLEEEVEERTKELVEEKKKSDLLLYRMLPQQVADHLKLGQAVEPEMYETATVFFSDVVSFTTIAAKGSPLQVVNLLNLVYTTFDSIIDDHDVYKFTREGVWPRQLLREANYGDVLSPGESSVVAGVVGLAMPRYCLFGDTVNTASRMETNGKPGMIHMSSEANQLLEDVGGFRTEKRGEVIIKGKGVMETYWLLGIADESVASLPARPSLPPIEPVTTGSVVDLTRKELTASQNGILQEGEFRVKTDCRSLMWMVVSDYGDELGKNLTYSMDIESIALKDLTTSLPWRVLQEYQGAQIYRTFSKNVNQRMENKVYWAMLDHFYLLKGAIGRIKDTHGYFGCYCDYGSGRNQRDDDMHIQCYFK